MASADSDEVEFKGRSIRMKGPLTTAEMQILRAEVREGLGKLTEIDVEFLSTKIDITLEDVVGQPVTIELDTEGGSTRYFVGHCVEILFEGTYENQGHYCASLRSWPWMLNRTADCRIFQEESAMDIIKKLFGEYGFSDYTDNTQTTYPAREYCVQYRESDWDFIYRLMVEEGIYFYFDYELGKDTMVMVASAGSHQNIAERSEVDFFFKEDGFRRRDDHIFDWRVLERLHTGKVTLRDYHFKNYTADLTATNTIATGKHSYKDYELYDWHGRYTESDPRGGDLARVRMEAIKSGHQRARGIGNMRTIACGYRFTLKNHPRTSANQEYLIVEAIHQLQIETDYNEGELEETALGERVTLDLEKNKDPYRVTFRVQPSQTEFRIPYECPRPKIAGLQTATVQGPDGQEIYTDVYGRVKVKFHWDRNPDGKNPEALTCWIRKAEPWSGKSWGMQWIPRVGQEVVVSFEEGDPDRPMIVGMLYNNTTTHPPFRGWEEAAATMSSQDDDGNSLSSPLTANQRMMGWMTRSTASGSAGTFHELAFDDTKDSEFIRFQSERDFRQIVKNNAVITIGLEHADAGDMTQTIKNNRTETVQEGDHTFTVETGNETYHVEANRDMTVNGDHTETIAGSQTVDVTGAISITSQDSITLTVGGSSITIDSSSITIESSTITLSASGSLDMSGGTATLSSDGTTSVSGSMTEVAGDSMVIVDGGSVMIN